MITKIKRHALYLASMLMLAMPTLLPTAVASAGCTHIGNEIAAGANAASGPNSNIGCSDPGSSAEGIKTLAGNLVSVFSIIVGIVSVIMIIYGGFRYITSGGDSGNVGNAKNTLIYAIVGLIIVALAQLIVHFVLSSTSTIANPPS